MVRDHTAERITEATNRLDVALSSLRAALARDVGISVPELLALENLGADGGLGPSELARRLQLSTGAVTALVDRLEASGPRLGPRTPATAAGRRHTHRQGE